jgi:hypothetical protein
MRFERAYLEGKNQIMTKLTVCYLMCLLAHLCVYVGACICLLYLYLCVCVCVRVAIYNHAYTHVSIYSLLSSPLLSSPPSTHA